MADRRKIAVVEDNPDNRMLVRALLEDIYDIQEFDNGPDALAGMRSSRPDAVLLDISLPLMDGTQILKEIRKDARLRGLPVVALTAHAMSGDRERYLAAGFDEYLSKPIVDEDKLLDILSKCLK